MRSDVSILVLLEVPLRPVENQALAGRVTLPVSILVLLEVPLRLSLSIIIIIPLNFGFNPCFAGSSS